MIIIDPSEKSTIFGYLGFDNYGDELLAKTLVEKLKLKDVSMLSKKSSFFKHLFQFIGTKQVFVVGGLFQDQTSYLSLLYYCVVLNIFQFFKKKVFLCAVGIGPLERKKSKDLLRFTLSGLQNISVRDQYSKDLLAELGIEAKLERDLAWSNPALTKSFNSNERSLVCIRNYNDWLLMKERFIFEEFDLLLMQKEFDLAQQIKAETKFKHGVSIIDANAFEYKALLEVIAPYEKLLTSRYHAAILGYQAQIDVGILELSPKLSSLLKTISKA